MQKLASTCMQPFGVFYLVSRLKMFTAAFGKCSHGPPNPLSLSTRDLSELERWEDDHEGGHAMQEFSYLVFNLLVFTAVENRPTTFSGFDGEGDLRCTRSMWASPIGGITRLAAQRAIDLWLDGDVRVWCSEGMNAGPSLLLSVLAAQESFHFQSCRKDWLAAMLHIDYVAATRACLEELSESCQATKQTKLLLKFCVRQICKYEEFSSHNVLEKQQHLSTLSMLERLKTQPSNINQGRSIIGNHSVASAARLALALIVEEAPRSCFGDYGYGFGGTANKEDDTTVSQKFVLLNIVMNSESQRIDIWHAAAAAQAGRRSPGGFICSMWDESAFFQFLLFRTLAAAARGLELACRGGLQMALGCSSPRLHFPSIVVQHILEYASHPMTITMEAAYRDFRTQTSKLQPKTGKTQKGGQNQCSFHSIQVPQFMSQAPSLLRLCFREVGAPDSHEFGADTVHTH